MLPASWDERSPSASHNSADERGDRRVPSSEDNCSVNNVGSVGASELWETMRKTHFPFALIDPETHLFVDCNAQYAALFGMELAELKGTNSADLYSPEIGRAIREMHASFMRRTLQSVRGQGELARSNGGTVELKGWSRLIEWDSGRPLIVTAAVEMHNGTLPDDRYWVAQAPHVFGLSDEWWASSHQAPANRAEQLEELWRIALEVRAGDLLPVTGETFPEGSIKELGDLTARQREIVARLVTGQRVKEIAADLYLSPSTVRNHLTAVFRKFRVHSQIELITRLKVPLSPG
jgi:PAS domain S-box-containing protein